MQSSDLASLRPERATVYVYHDREAGRYCVQAYRPDGGQVPSFYLYASVQGITSPEHAERIARDILGEAVQS